LDSRIKELLYDVDVDIGSFSDITELHILAPPLLNELAGDEHDFSSGKGIFVLHGTYPTQDWSAYESLTNPGRRYQRPFHDLHRDGQHSYWLRGSALITVPASPPKWFGLTVPRVSVSRLGLVPRDG